MNPQTNIGWQYYRNYFHGQNLSNDTILEKGKSKIVRESDATESKYNEKNKNLTETAYNISALFSYYSENANSIIHLYTTYPGLLIGSGYQHEVAAKGELKLGFFFDHTTGLPVIPGSSVKGLLRSAFPQWEKDKKTSETKKEAKTCWIESLITGKPIEEIKFNDELREKIHKIELAIFEGVKDKSKIKPEEKYFPIYNRDIFFDAIITKAGKNAWILATDSITPHIKDDMTYEQAMLKNPTPILFLKILPDVCFQFNFDLKCPTIEGIDAARRKELFQKILLTIGIGAKTNVGYGQFSETHTGTGNSTSVPIVGNIPNEPEVPQKKELPKTNIHPSNYPNYPAGQKYMLVVDRIEEGYVYFKNGKDELVKAQAAIDKKWNELGENRKKKGKSNEYQVIAIGMTFEIEVKKSFDVIEQVFSISPIWK